MDARDRLLLALADGVQRLLLNEPGGSLLSEASELYSAAEEFRDGHEKGS